MEHSRFLASALDAIEHVRSHPLNDEERREMAIELAAYILYESYEIQTSFEKKMANHLALLVSDKTYKAFMTDMVDQVFRSHNSYRIADQMLYLIRKYGIPKSLPWWNRWQMRAFSLIGKPFAPLIIPLVKYVIRKITANIILPAEPKLLFTHLRKRRKEGVRMNLNHIGEAILGEEEAATRLADYLRDLANEEVECVSIKISTLYSQINPLAWDETIAAIVKQLQRLYRIAKDNHYVKNDGTKAKKLVYLDVEGYKDFHLTIEAFKRTLDLAEFYDYSAGIVLQSYLPDSFLIQRELTNWARRRVSHGGSPIFIRIVKGANLFAEKQEASLKNWSQAPYHTKAEVDANYKRMVHYGCVKEHAKASHIGIASHNLFDIAYALLLRVEMDVEEYVHFEMLEGMVDAQSKVVQKISQNMLLYCPAAKKHIFQSAFAYLLRRLDENTTPGNFLKDLFDMVPGSHEWFSQVFQFTKACHDLNKGQIVPLRVQNRFKEPKHLSFNSPFQNEPDTDWCLPQNRKWAELYFQKRSLDIHLPPSLDEEEAQQVLQRADESFKRWKNTPVHARAELISEVAKEMRLNREKLIYSLISEGKKAIVEADSEVSEAIDFAEYYLRSLFDLHALENIEWHPKGVALVAPPWNFPCSIAVGGVIAAIAAGNTVILKPSPEGVKTGWILVNILWKAGVGKDVLQYIRCEDEPFGSMLIQDSRVKLIVLTGATETAKYFLKIRPKVDLIAETGGKNAMIISSMSDRDLAISHLVQSAFSHSAQKCSACSLAVLEKEVYDDIHFRKQLVDAVKSLKIGSQWDMAVKITPLVQPQNPNLIAAFTSLGDGEEWLLEPKCDPEDHALWSPGIKIGVKAGSFMHRHECFGPVLSLMAAEDLTHAIEIVNATAYGLTSGLHSLDEREHREWISKIDAGNCYINRTITGAIVQRQPFGGCKESSYGRGFKAGGPNYLIQFMTPVEIHVAKEDHLECDMEEQEKLNYTFAKSLNELQACVQDHLNSDDFFVFSESLKSYCSYYESYFSKDHDPSKVVGQLNVLRYVQEKGILLRVNPQDALLDIFRIAAVSILCRTPLYISAKSTPSSILHLKKFGIDISEESEEELLNRLPLVKFSRIRLLSENDDLLTQLAEKAIKVTIAKVLSLGRLELLHALREVSISYDYHRYGYTHTTRTLEKLGLIQDIHLHDTKF